MHSPQTCKEPVREAHAHLVTRAVFQNKAYTLIPNHTTESAVGRNRADEGKPTFSQSFFIYMKMSHLVHHTLPHYQSREIAFAWYKYRWFPAHFCLNFLVKLMTTLFSCKQSKDWGRLFLIFHH